MCLDKAIPRDEEIVGKENVYVTKEEMRSKVITPILRSSANSTHSEPILDCRWASLVMKELSNNTWKTGLKFFFDFQIKTCISSMVAAARVSPSG